MVDGVSRFSGFAEDYDAVRPVAPEELLALLRDYAQAPAPAVVDIGAGTGPSTRPWQDVAGELIAVEPNPDMAAVAARRAPRARIVAGTAEATGLPDACADVVTASQALHWFDAEKALPEIARVLRPGGVFAAYDCDWPPTVHPEVDAAYVEFDSRQNALCRELGLEPTRAPKHTHLDRMRASGRFRFTRELAMHRRDVGDADRLFGLAASQGGVVALRRAGVADERFGLDVLTERARRHLPEPVTWWWTYRIRLGVR